MNKITIVSDLGFYHPSNANWNYRMHLVIDKTGARFYKSTFGGESRMVETLTKQGVSIEKLYAGKGSNVAWKYADMKDLPDIEQYNGKNY